MVKHACTAAYSVCVVFYAVNGLIIQTLAMMLDKMEGEKYFQQKSKKKKKKMQMFTRYISRYGCHTRPNVILGSPNCIPY